MEKFFDALKKDENPFARYLYGEFKRTGDPKTMSCLIEEQEEHTKLQELINERER